MLRPALVLVLLLYHHDCRESGEVQPYFVSQNFRTVLRWGEVDPGVDILYSVSYSRYGTRFVPKLACQNLTTLFCDLSSETNTDPTSKYWAQVYANTELLGKTEDFIPLTDTDLGPPTLSVRQLDGSVEVTCSLPPEVEEVLNNLTLSYSHPAAYYNLNITGNANVQQISNEVFHLQTAGGLEVCGSVMYRPHLDQHRSSQEATFCITPDNPWRLLPWLLSLACLLVGCVPIVTVLVCRYVRQQPEPPACTKVTSSQGPPHLLQPQKVIPSLAQAEGPCLGGTEGARKPPLTRPQVSRDSGCYAPQDTPSSTPPLWQQGPLSPQSPPLWKQGPLSPQSPPLWQQGPLSPQSPLPEDSDNSLHSSTIYSMVGVQSAREGGPSPLGPTESHTQLCVSPAGEPPFQSPLKLPPSLGQTDTPVCLPLHSHIQGGFPLSNLATTGERAPLLSDLLCMGDSDWLDPEETCAYASQHAPLLCPPEPAAPWAPPGEPSSGYKQSWVPGRLVEGDQEEGEEEGEVEEGEEGEGEEGEGLDKIHLIPLEDWGVHVLN